MKKALLILLMSAIAFAAFADDAKVMPAGVIRTYVVPTYAFGSQSFDADGEKVDDAQGTSSFFNLGGAVEFGATDWISAAVQWGPGYNLYSDIENNENAKAIGAFELFTGAKIQILGDQGLVKNDKFRFAVAPGIMIPMSFGYDPEEELTNMGLGQEFNVDPATSAFGFGGRIYADYVINDMFFVNLYGEFIKFAAKDADKDFTATMTNAMMAPIPGFTPYEKINYGYKLTTEVDFNFEKQLSETLILGGGLPVGFTYSPEYTFDDAEADSDNASYTVSVNPSLSAMVLALPLPVEFEVSYRMPLMGQNASVMNTLTAQIKAYMKF